MSVVNVLFIFSFHRQFETKNRENNNNSNTQMLVELVNIEEVVVDCPSGTPRV